MIRTFSEYRIFCDGCGAEFTVGFSEYTFDNLEQAEEFDPEDISGWVRKDGKHFCEKCKDEKENAK